MNKIGEAIRNNNLPAYQAERYPAVPDGETLIFSGEDFTNTDFSAFPMGFSSFEQCVLDGVRNLYGQPIALTDCSARGIDFRGLSLVLHARNTDFTGMKYDENTVLAKGENHSPSTFTGCTLDDDAAKYFADQGVIITP